MVETIFAKISYLFIACFWHRRAWWLLYSARFSKSTTQWIQRKNGIVLLCLQLFFFLPKCWTFRNYWAAHKKFQSWISNFYQFKLEFRICVIVRWCIQLSGLCLITTKNFCPISSTAKLSVLCSTVCVFYSAVLAHQLGLIL